MSAPETWFEQLSATVVERPKQIVIICLALTILLVPGMTLLESEAGPDQFLDDVPEADALEEVNQEFEPAFDPDNPTTQLIQQDENVLDRGALLRLLETKDRIAERDHIQISEITSPASQIAQEIDQDAESAAEQYDLIESATTSELREATHAAAETPGFGSLLADDFNPEEPRASAAIAVLTHEFPDETDVTPIQREMETIAERSDGDFIVFGSGILDDEFETVIFDSLTIVIPAALGVILFLLAYAYRDPFDFLLGAIALIMTIIWTFGFTGYAGIPFSDILVAVPVLLLAIGIDFGIHSVNRYREERSMGATAQSAMRIGMGQLVVAFAVITGTTVIGFLANVTSDLGAIREFGIVAAIGIIFTLIIFAVFFPAAKVLVDDWRERYNLPQFTTRPLGSEGSYLGRALLVLSIPSRKAPHVFLLIVLILSLGAGVYGSGVDTTFDDEDFLPPEDEPGYITYLPGPVQPGEYTVTATIGFLEDTFETSEDDTVTIYLQTRMTDDQALRILDRAARDPPESFVVEDGAATGDSIIDVIEAYADEDPDFATLVGRSTLDGWPPDRNLDQMYSELRRSDFADVTQEYLASDDRSTRVIFDVRTDATDEEITADARAVADRYRGDAIATGQIVVFQAVADTIFESAIRALGTALILSSIFLVVLFGLFVGRPSLGIVTLVPVVVAILGLTATMRALDIPFNALTATILAITIGLGVDYAVHMVHRFYEEYSSTGDIGTSLNHTIRGTGGALTGTMLTTALGMIVLVLAITPILGQFGLLTALSIILSYFAALVILPAALILWVGYIESAHILPCID